MDNDSDAPGDSGNTAEKHGLTRRSFMAATASLVAATALSNSPATGQPNRQTKNVASGAERRPRSMLVKNATVLVTMDKARREIKNGGMYIEDGLIKQVGDSSTLPNSAEMVLDLKEHVVLPGMVNTHHHLFQHLTRVAPAGQDGSLENWARVMYPMWHRMTPGDLRLSVQVALAELVLSGCTTVFDQQFVFPNGCSLDDAIVVAKDMGVRFHASRGFMSLGRSRGGTAPDDFVEDESAILKDCQRLIDKHHDLNPGAMTRIVIAPSTLSTVSKNMMVESARLARSNNCRLHTVLAETLNDAQYTLKRYNLRPVELLESLNWLGNDVFVAHAVHIDNADISRLAKTGTGIAHCPSSNMRLASGIAPVKKMRDAGINVGLAVDGASSNDSGHLLAEVRMSMLLARTLLALSPEGPPADKMAWLTARDCLEMSTIGGAALLGRDDIGSLEPGKRADFFSVKTNSVHFAGGSTVDPVAALVFCTPRNAAYTVIDGRVIVRDEQLETLDLQAAIDRLNQASRRLMGVASV
jgi:8-oxoguanine deaminase